MITEIVERVVRSSRYRDVDRSLLSRLAAEELPRARNPEDAVKRVKRRLHQVVGAFRGAPQRNAIEEAWNGDLTGSAFRAACIEALRGHASTRERIPHLESFYAGIWARTGVPARICDVGCGLNPLALPWMGIGDATYLATDVDQRPLQAVSAFFELVGQPHEVRTQDVVTEPPTDEADVALLLKLVTTLDRQDPQAATRILQTIRARHAVVSFATRSMGGRGDGRDRIYRSRMERLVAEARHVSAVAEASVPSELVFVLTLDG